MKQVLLLLSLAAPRPATFPYHHLETTGLTDEVQLPDGSRQAIQFSHQSNQAQVKALGALLGCGVFGTLDGKGTQPRIVLVGDLLPTVLHTPGGPGMASSEPYRELVLRSWSLVPPTSLAKVCPKALRP